MTRVGAREKEREREREREREKERRRQREGLSAGRDVGERRDVRGGCIATHAPFARP